MRFSTFVSLFVAVIVLAGVPGRSAAGEAASESKDTAAGEAKKAGHELIDGMKAVGKDLRESKAGRYVEESAKEFGHDAASAGKEGWTKAKELTASGVEQVRLATREFWDDLMKSKQETLDRLKKENQALKRSKGENGHPRSEPAKEVP